MSSVDVQISEFSLDAVFLTTGIHSHTHTHTHTHTQFLGLSIHLYPAQLHSFPLSIFASLIAPFGGFFASGFKRAFNIKVSSGNYLLFDGTSVVSTGMY